MHAISYQPAEAEDVDLFELLEQWEPADNTAGPSARFPLGSAPAQMSCIGALESFSSLSRTAGLPAPVPAPVPGKPLPGNRPTLSSAFQQYSDHAPHQATYMCAPSLYLKGRYVTEGPLPKACSPAVTSWQQQPIYMPPQQSLASALIAQGSLTSLSASLDAEDSTAAVSSPSHPRRAGSRRHKTEAWRQKNRQAQKKFRQRKKESWKAQEEEVSRLTDEVDILQQRRQQLQEALAAAQQGSTGRISKDGLMLSLEMAQVALNQRDLEEMQVQGAAELWKGMTERMALCLPEAQRQPSGDLAHQAQALGREAMQLLWALADHSPGALAALEGYNLELCQPACHNGSPWESVLGQLQLAPQQVRAMRAVHDMLSSNLARLLAERRALVAKLQGLPVTGTDVLLQHGRQLVDQIRANVHAAHVCKAYHISHVWLKILRPLQRVQVIVWVYPSGPDMLSLMSAAARAGNAYASADQVASGEAATGSLSPAHVEKPAARTPGRAGLRGQALRSEGSDATMVRSLMLPDPAHWRAALVQPLSLLRKEP